MTSRAAEAIDVVYTWVDGAWPGYAEELQTYADRPIDLNPNRYRDNLDLLKYSIRSLFRYAPWHRHVYLVTARPQVPEWLDVEANGVTVVHHDEFYDPGHLPTFSSFSLLCNLAKIRGVSDRFLYMEDDRLLGRDVALSDLATADGGLKLYAKFERTDDARGWQSDRLSPWESALAYSNHLLDERYGPSPRMTIKHAPVLFDREEWAAFESRFEKEVAYTSASRFRSKFNIAAEHMYPYSLLHEGRAERVGIGRSFRDTSYLGLGNSEVVCRMGLAHLALRRPMFFCLNDNFGDTPNSRVVGRVREWLEARYPDPSPLERIVGAGARK